MLIPQTQGKLKLLPLLNGPNPPSRVNFKKRANRRTSCLASLGLERSHIHIHIQKRSILVFMILGDRVAKSFQLSMKNKYHNLSQFFSLLCAEGIFYVRFCEVFHTFCFLGFFCECLSFQVTLVLGLFLIPFRQSISEFLPRSYYVKPVVLKSWIPIPGIMTSNPKIECIVVSEGKQQRKETLGTNREG